MLDNFEKKKEKHVPFPKGRDVSESCVKEIRSLISELPISRDMLIEYFHVIQDKYRCIKKKASSSNF